MVSNTTTAIDPVAQLKQLAQDASTCVKCKLCEGRTQSVFFDGNPRAKIMLIGEGPGQQEDEQGLPFVGRSGQLLTQIIESAHFSRKDDTYICNMVKCRPPGNRNPEPVEMAACREYLDAQIHYVRPRIILLVGAVALNGMLGIKSGITKLRGQWMEMPIPENPHLDKPFGDAYTAQVMPILHPAYLLRNPSKEHGKPKWQMWQDIKEVRRVYDTL